MDYYKRIVQMQQELKKALAKSDIGVNADLLIFMAQSNYGLGPAAKKYIQSLERVRAVQVVDGLVLVVNPDVLRGTNKLESLQSSVSSREEGDAPGGSA